MSWSINVTGKKAAIQKHVRETEFHGHIEEKNLIEHYLNGVADDAFVHVEGNGHAQPGYASTTIKVNTILFVE